MCASAAWRGESYHTHSAQRITLRISGRASGTQTTITTPLRALHCMRLLDPVEITTLLLFFASFNVETLAD